MEHTEYDSDPQTPPAPGERLRVARIGKPHGVRGEVTVELFTDDPTERLAPGAVLQRASAAGAPLSALTVATQRWNKKICLLGFEEVPDRNGAEEIRGSILFIDLVDQNDDAAEGWYSHQLEGFRCVSDQGVPLGTVAVLLTGPAQDLLVVTAPGGEEVMVPFVDELVPEIDPQQKLVTLAPPVGLFP
jgi:16S rRNA processing protein RimM